ncbi:MAG: DUF2165 domain-containing protein [Scytolyngbya sp. HA4215-MV1]|jgi:predicted small integral membrane protein|nr:DUF2165 domain-containing protein [Scytolyngbya sp. HA4215-MV1]
MAERLAKILLIGAIAVFFSIVLYNNFTDYSTNFAFVQHVLAMDTIFPTSSLRWRAITHPILQHAFFWTIIVWESITVGCCWFGIFQLSQAIRADAPQFNAAKSIAILGLTASCLLWLMAFLVVGGEWFAMWQSPIWNGQPIASRMVIISLLILIFVRQPEFE